MMLRFSGILVRSSWDLTYVAKQPQNLLTTLRAIAPVKIRRLLIPSTCDPSGSVQEMACNRRSVAVLELT